MHSDRIKLLKFVTLFAVGGTEKHVVGLSRALHPSLFDLHWACLKRWGELLKEIEDGGRPLSEYNIPCLYHHKAFREQWRFSRYVKRHRVEIVHAYNFHSNIFAIPAARLGGAPVVVASIRNIGTDLTPMQRRAQKLICRLADSVLVNAEAVRQWLIEDGYNPAKITVIRNGIDLSQFTGSGGHGGLRQELGLPPQAPLIVLLSRLDRLKGIEFFLDAAALVADRFPEARFLIVGDGGFVRNGDAIVHDVVYRRRLETHVDRLGLGRRVLFTGFRLDVPELLSDVAVSVLPSLSEGLSNTLLESMAAGVPVVATRVGGNPEVVEHGVTGLLVPPRDSAALAEAVGFLLKNPNLASRFGRAGRQRVAEFFSMERMVRETERLYLSLLKPGQINGDRHPIQHAEVIRPATDWLTAVKV